MNILVEKKFAIRWIDVIAVAVVMVGTVNALEIPIHCGELVLDDEAQEVIIGQYGPIQYIHPFGSIILPSYELGVCWRDKEGSWNLEHVSSCGTSSTKSLTNMFSLSTMGGDDYVSVLSEEQSFEKEGDSNWIRSRLLNNNRITYGMRCGLNVNRAIAPWDPNFDFGVSASLGAGADEFYGTPNNDRVASNYVVRAEFRPGPFSPVPRPISYNSAPADNSIDLLCGSDGDDELLGDRDDNWLANAEEWLDGGPGQDSCDGDPPDGLFELNEGGNESDVVTEACEMRDHAYLLDHLFSCEERKNPIEVLGL